MLPSFLLAAVMAVIVYFLPISSLNIYLQLVIQILCGGIIYLLGSIIFKLESFIYLKNILLNVFMKGKKKNENDQ
jgi:hypothetical protein